MDSLKVLKVIIGNMPTIKDLNESEIESAIVDKKGNVICPMCKKKQAIVTDYGMIRKCQSCASIKPDYNVMVRIQEPGGMRSY